MALRSVLAVALAFGVFATPALAVTKLDMTNEYEAHSIHGQGDTFFANKVKELSNGAVEITLHLGGSLGFKSKDNLDAVGDGAVPIADTIGGVLAGSDSIFLLSSLPFLAANAEEARTLYTISLPAYEEFFKKNGQRLLYASPWPASGLWAKNPVDTVDAIKGLKMRTYDANGTRTLIEAEASPIQLSWADVVPQLATNGIQGVLTSAEGGVNAKFWEHLSHFTEVNYAMPLNFVHINGDAFDNMSKEKQDAILAAAKQADERNWAALLERVQGNYKTLKENNVTIVEEISPELQAHLAKAATKVISDWKETAGPRGEMIIKAYSDKVGRSY
ncbi:TRAP transporter substrate-binding protein [Sneathiella litorea]|uniref:C4-dicarboxylate ABC transporter substrate-binding protein n=1 Tax=Sneathiella litorea TaxID=2606216 RepID=A0A6L8W7V4_9PROT|nr:TRAP transporter substrate-binding protein [Sneathiella litorea]MZR30729.1 C4-dicarboxylate ABC transporter substrate-binding protein [Sneathiella litorea]